MHCPSCGTKAEVSQKYCRSCGFGLEGVAQLLTENAVGLDVPAADIELEGRLRTITIWRDRALIGFFALILSGFCGYGIIYRLMWLEGKILPGLALLLFIFVAVATVVLCAMADELSKERKTIAARKPASLPPAETTSKLQLPAPSEPVLSVTEATTKSFGEMVPLHTASGDLVSAGKRSKAV